MLRASILWQRLQYLWAKRASSTTRVSTLSSRAAFEFRSASYRANPCARALKIMHAQHEHEQVTGCVIHHRRTDTACTLAQCTKEQRRKEHAQTREIYRRDQVHERKEYRTHHDAPRERQAPNIDAFAPPRLVQTLL